MPSDDLQYGELQVEGQLVAASNATLLCTVVATGEQCVYKPQRGERELWDFPSGTLARRELATATVSTALGWDLVPETVWREEGPYGPGMCQRWIHGDADLVVVAGLDAIPAGWHTVLRAHDAEGNRVYLAHADRIDVQRLAILDAIVNNADRKAGHILRDADDRIWAIDHGVTFAEDPKLRTVLWGWAGEPIPESIQEELKHFADVPWTALQADLALWLTPGEIEATDRRLNDLLNAGTFAYPTDEWPAIPWPVF